VICTSVAASQKAYERFYFVPRHVSVFCLVIICLTHLAHFICLNSSAIEFGATCQLLIYFRICMHAAGRLKS